MLVYHVSDVVIEKPDLKRGRKNADFGQGFYLSTDIDFSLKWATMDGLLNVYDIDLEGLKVKRFKRDKEWFEYIYNNRRLKDLLDDYDVIIGPIANDTIYDTWGILTSGFVDKEKSLECLMVGNEYTQLVVKTEKAKEKLVFKYFKKIEKDDLKNNKAKTRNEEQKYQKMILGILGDDVKEMLS